MTTDGQGIEGRFATQRSVALPATVVYGDADLDVDYQAVLAGLVTTQPNRRDGCGTAN